MTSKKFLPVYDKPVFFRCPPSCWRAYATSSSSRRLQTCPTSAACSATLGLRIQVAVQPRPDGARARAIIGQDFLAGSPRTLILGDNSFYDDSRPKKLLRREEGARGHRVRFPTAPSRPVRRDRARDTGTILSIEENKDFKGLNPAIQSIVAFTANDLPTGGDFASGHLLLSFLNTRYPDAQIETLL